jgi:hypothetical protein
MTPQETAHIYAAILTLADCVDTLTGNERKTMIALMESLNMMAGGVMGDIEAWMMLTKVDVVRQNAMMN